MTTPLLPRNPARLLAVSALLLAIAPRSAMSTPSPEADHHAHRLGLLLRSGETWRGHLGDAVLVTFSENQVEQTLAGILRYAGDSHIQVDCILAGRLSTKTIVFRSIETIASLARHIGDTSERPVLPNLSDPGSASAPLWIELTDCGRSVAQLIASAADGSVVSLMLGDRTMSDCDAMLVLHAIHASRQRDVRMFASFSDATGPSAAIAMACDGLIPIGDAAITATSPSSRAPAVREFLVGITQELSDLDRRLISVVLDGTGSLSWSPEDGFQTNNPRAVRLAENGVPASIRTHHMLELGLASRVAGSPAEALQLIATGSIQPRLAASAGQRVLRSAAPLGDNRRVTGTAPAPSKPVNQSAIAKAMAEHDRALEQLRVDVREFHLYFIGRKGIWTRDFGRLRDVWEGTSEMTSHINTQMAVANLQRSMKRSITTMKNCARRVQTMLGDWEHPALRQHRDQVEALDLLYAAISRNRATDYERSAQAILSMGGMSAAR